MSLALSSVRDNLSPAVFKDVENFFFFFQNMGSLSQMVTACPFLLAPFGLPPREMLLLEAWAILSMREAQKVL